MLQHINFARATVVVSSSLTILFGIGALPGFAQVITPDNTVFLSDKQPAQQPKEQPNAGCCTGERIESTLGVDDLTAQSTESMIDREAAIQELVEALTIDGVALQPAPAPLLENLENTLREQPQPLGASALSGLSSMSSASIIPLETTEADLAAVSASFQVDRASVPALRIALDSDNPRTQLYAADALWTLTGDTELILPTLISVANSEEVEVRELALLALSQLGNEALPAAPLLEALTSDRNSRTRSIAEDALAVVRSENRPATALGIIARETGRLVGMPGLFEALSGLWR